MTPEEYREIMIWKILKGTDWFRRSQLEAMANEELESLIREIYG